MSAGREVDREGSSGVGGERQPGLSPRDPQGLCPTCPQVRRIVSERGSVFFLCRAARDDARLPRYPPQPRWSCPAHPVG